MASHFILSLPTLKHLISDPESLANMAPGRDIYAGWTDWESLGPSPDFFKAFPYYIMGFDNEGRVGKDFQLLQFFFTMPSLLVTYCSLHNGIWDMGLSGIDLTSFGNTLSLN